MSSKKKKNNIFHSFAFRLTLRYAGIFSIFLILIFTVSYNSLVSGLQHNVDNGLLAEIKEIEQDFNKEGIDQVVLDIHEEIEGIGNGMIFCRLLTSDLKVEAVSDLSRWGYLDIPVLDLWAKKSLSGQTVFRTIPASDKRFKVRIITRSIAGGKYVVQIGQIMEDTEEIARHYRKVFGGAVFLLFVCGIVLAWMVANKAMSGVQRVTQTARNIGREGFHHRVQPGKEGEEIEELAETFNTMLDRVELLMQELKDVTNNLAHDLRTPITRMRGMAETTLNNKQDISNYQEVVGVIVEECDRLVRMINTILEIAQADAGLKTFSQKPVDLTTVVQKGVETFLPVAQDKKIQINLQCPSDSVMVLGDVSRLQRVISNLLDNAVKFTDSKGKVSVVLKTADSDAVISIKDTGIGIALDQQQHIFEKFYRAESSRTAPGHGLGLSFVKAIISSMDGSVTVDSVPGHGATFVIRIPLKSC